MLDKLKQLWSLVPFYVGFVAVNFSQAEIKIEVIYPKEGSQVIAAESTFVFGNVSSVEVVFSVNDIATKLYHNGAFLAYVPVEPGNFEFRCQAVANNDTVQVIRNVYIPPYLRTCSEESLIIDTSYVFPRADWELRPGDIFKIAFKGTPNCEATFSIDGLLQGLPMAELPARKSFNWGEAIFGEGTNLQMSKVKGIYIGVYIIQDRDWAEAREIRFKLKDKYGNEATAVAPGKLNIDNSTIPRIVELTQEATVERSGPSSGGQLFLPQGAKVWVTGRHGNHLRTKLSATENVWILDENIKILPLGTPLPEGMVTSIQTEEFEKKIRLKISLDQKLPFKIELRNKPASLSITLYGVIANYQWTRLEYDETLIQDISWAQKATNVCEIKIELKQAQCWGYHPFYEEGGLYIDIKKKLKVRGKSSLPLKDVVICLDPGHGPETGAIGPKGFIEKDMNYKYCVALKKKLEAKGAFVVLTRGENYGATMKARIQHAVFVEADILLSFHFNALPDGVNPFKNHGISTYYYHPQGYRLAYLIQKMLVKKTGVKNFGLFYENLAICRTPQMIAVLTEPGFIMHPWEEILIASETYQEQVVDAIVIAIEQFLKESI